MGLSPFCTYIGMRGRRPSRRCTVASRRVCQNANFDAHSKVRQNG